MFGGGIGSSELLLLFLLILLLFGAKRLPEIGRSVGKGLREFRKAVKEVRDDLDLESEPTAKRPPQVPNQQSEPKEKKTPPAG